MEFLNYFYVGLWAILAVLMFFTAKKQGAFAYLLSGFFVFMTIWYGLDTFTQFNMFEGVLSIVFRGVLVVFLALLIIVYFLLKKKNIAENDDTDKEI